MPPKGFRASAVAAGLKYPDRLDLGLIVCDNFQASTGVFTKNICQAAPVIWSKARADNARAILANAGQANAQTGSEGMSDCRESARQTALLLGLETEQVLLASTGIIGRRINTSALLAALPKLTESLSTNGFGDFARAIMTTDTVAKIAESEIIFTSGPKASVWGAAKGSGMIAPNMATMLGFILTDAAVDPGLINTLLKDAANSTFNRITVDGDTSTNDSVFLIASGASGRAPITKGKDSKSFEAALFCVMESLARAMVRDGEGATRLVEIVINGAKDSDQAQKAARTVAESPLVKTAIFGADANWGRIMAALGRSGAIFEPYKVNIFLDDLLWVANGCDNGKDQEASQIMKLKEYRILIELGAGKSNYNMFTCDFSHDYVTINGSYRS